jgi:glycerate 2-kinase
MREHALEIYHAAVQSVVPGNLLPGYMELTPRRLRLADQVFTRPETTRLSKNGRLYVVGAGKASAAMAAVTEQFLIDVIYDGVVVTKYDHGMRLGSIRLIEAAHPIPDAMSVQAGKEILELVQKAGEGDIVLALVSGGASALLMDCPPGVSLADLQQVFNHLLQCGAAIGEINIIRKHLSPGIKGGQLARMAWPATLVSFILSDVIGDPLDSIASGPTVGDPSTYADAWAILEKYQLIEKIPYAVARWLKSGLEGQIAETPQPGDAIFQKTHNYLVGTNRVALDAAAARAKQLHYHPVILTDTLSGEARDQAAALVQQIIHYNGPRPACLLLGGETTVTIKNKGKGGRNQEFVLAALRALQDIPLAPGRIPVILSAGTDGTDGPTDAAGAVMDDDLLKIVAEKGLNAEHFLQQNDSYHFFQQAGGHVITGATQTNVMDVVVALLQ